MAKKKPEKDWLMPPPSEGLKSLKVAKGTDRKGNWVWKKIKQTPKDIKLRKKWTKKMEKADAKGKDSFKWPPKK